MVTHSIVARVMRVQFPLFTPIKKIKNKNGYLTQLVEYTPDKGAVGGSNPPISTKNIKA